MPWNWHDFQLWNIRICKRLMLKHSAVILLSAIIMWQRYHQAFTVISILNELGILRGWRLWFKLKIPLFFIINVRSLHVFLVDFRNISWKSLEVARRFLKYLFYILENLGGYICERISDCVRIPFFIRLAAIVAWEIFILSARNCGFI